MRFTPFDGEEGATAQGAHIELELPQSGLQYKDGMDYANEDMGIVRGAMISGIGDTSAGAVEQSVGDFFSNIGDKQTRRLAAKTLIAMTGNKIAQASSRTAPNPNTRAFFKGPKLREFEFSFKMIPTSVEEAEAIKNIILQFRKNMYPERLSKGDLRIGFHYPWMFLIEAFVGEDTGLAVEPKIKPCYLKDMGISYNSNSGAIMAENGSSHNFSETVLTLSFSEEVTLSQSDILEGF